MGEQLQPLVVDGPRPAVVWVSTLPAEWVRPSERLVLYVLALDAYNGTSRPSGDAIASWTGLQRRRVYDILTILATPNDVRPALIERVDREGRPLGEKRYGGRARTGYRLMADRTQNPTLLAVNDDDHHAPGTVGGNCTDSSAAIDPEPSNEAVDNSPLLSGIVHRSGNDAPVDKPPELSPLLSPLLSGKSAHSLPFPPGVKNPQTVQTVIHKPPRRRATRAETQRDLANEQTRQLAALKSAIAQGNP